MSQPTTAPATKQQGTKKGVLKEILSWIFTLSIAVILALGIRTFVFSLVEVKGSSMEDTLHNTERVFTTRFDYYFSSPKHNDVVICRYPDRTDLFVKRVIALPGDTIEIRYNSTEKKNEVLLNGEILEESFLTATRNRRKVDLIYLSFLPYDTPYTLLEDEYFVMGDNRDNSNDSRNIGPISKKAIEGKVRFAIFPFSNWRVIH